MVTVKKTEQIEKMRKAGKVLANAFIMIKQYIKEDIVTKDIDKILEDFLFTNNTTPSFKGYGGFPATACISINDIVVHGIPNNTKLKNGDIVGIDIGCIFDGWHADAARTFCVGRVSGENLRLIENTEKCFFEGINHARVSSFIGDISAAIEECATGFGYGVVKSLTGHGIGSHLHEDPQIPNFGKKGTGIVIKQNNTFAIEPMINLGSGDVYTDSRDGWTVRTVDKLNSAHYENTILITDGEPEILTL